MEVTKVFGDGAEEDAGAEDEELEDGEDGEDGV